jgi:hypothetical protein
VMACRSKKVPVPLEHTAASAGNITHEQVGDWYLFAALTSAPSGDGVP